ncbi:MAG: cardiolipin synthase [Spongiibacteraceae bacterium]
MITNENLLWLFIALHVIIAVTTSIHALLFKQDSRSALGWIAACIAYPLAGPLLYCLFGVNRVETRAHKLSGKNSSRFFAIVRKYDDSLRQASNNINNPLPPIIAKDTNLTVLTRISTAVTHRPLVGNNHITPFFDGDSAYQAMIDAIDQAQNSISLASYILDTNQSGRCFIDALSNAQNRGVKVRVLVDGIGELYSFPTASRLLRKKKVPVARYNPPRLFPPSLNINLRNHRKLLIIDNYIGFTGGMNIGDRHLQQMPNGKPGISDIHCRLQGPIALQLQQVFNEDWAYATGQPEQSIAPPPPSMATSTGDACCRVVTDGPNEDLGKLAMVITGAAALARHRIAIMTPYFLPPSTLINALQSAALRGVDVSVILPANSNQPLVHWASRNILWELLQLGIKIYYQPAPFCHSKLMLIDDDYAHIGSANLDPRSLRLNFELIVEVFDQALISTLSAHFNHIRELSSEETLEGVDQRSFLIRIRDALAWLFSPYL